jgi:hypothetical protein
LIIYGGLDFATPMEFGELLYSKLKGSGKGVMVVNFDCGTHCSGEAVAESTETPCHDTIIAAFKRNDGVDNIDTSCMNNLLYFGMEYIALQRVNCDTYMQRGYRLPLSEAC